MDKPTNDQAAAPDPTCGIVGVGAVGMMIVGKLPAEPAPTTPSSIQTGPFTEVSER